MTKALLTMRAFLVAALVGLTGLTLTSCETMEGVGEDVEQTGEEVQEEAEEAEEPEEYEY